MLCNETWASHVRLACSVCIILVVAQNSLISVLFPSLHLLRRRAAQLKQLLSSPFFHFISVDVAFLILFSHYLRISLDIVQWLPQSVWRVLSHDIFTLPLSSAKPHVRKPHFFWFEVIAQIHHVCRCWHSLFLHLSCSRIRLVSRWGFLIPSSWHSKVVVLDFRKSELVLKLVF